MGFIKSFFASKVSQTFEQEAASVVRVCESFGKNERTELKVCVLLALATFAAEGEKTGDRSFRCFFEAMHSSSSLDAEGLASLSSYTMKLIAMQDSARTSPSRIVNLTGAGVPIWIVSMRALSHVEILPYARKLWSIVEDSDSLSVYDQITDISRRLGNAPTVDILLRLRTSFQTPDLFKQH